ncbi:hypothetical protein Y032_0130g1558 [Ancylostoma ceylanicum]|uniref:Uncharacterized protein n=1 Tax=Ancylostoma ceylanicum TaxID=53326 RepID=A0A016T7N2_9BILA|nr:hypothetical protein Y032_0130g1558 [Ancylostoma ceylanicum]
MILFIAVCCKCCSTHCGQLDLHGASRPFVPVSPRDFAFMEAHYSCDVACTVGVAGGDSVAASKSTWSERAAQARILSGATNCEVFLTIRHCSTDSSVSGAVATRSFRGRGWVAAIDAHCTYIQRVEEAFRPTPLYERKQEQ